MLYEQPRDRSLARERAAFASPAMIFTPQGLMLGAGTILVTAEGARKLQNLKGREQCVLALLSAAYNTAVAPSVLGNIERAAKSWSEGNDFVAHIHLAHTGLHALDDFPRAAHRLRMAKGALDHGASPRAVFEALHLDARYIGTLEKLYNPAQPRVPAGHPDGGEWTRGDWSGAANASSDQVLSDAMLDNTWKPGAQYAANEPPPPGIGHNQGPPLEPAPEVSEVGPPYNTTPFWDFAKTAVRWLGKAGWRPLLRLGVRIGLEATIGGPIGDFLLAVEAAYWAHKAYPYIRSYFDPPHTLEELQQNAKPGYDEHHIVEQWSKKDGVPRAMIDSPENIVPIPKLKHWEINSWLGKPNRDYENAKGDPISPREYMKGKSWEERYEFGLKVLREFGVLKP
ncbi:MAG: hypothetical protein ACLP19_00475 [Xanthobacteraceae bacterium]